MATHKRIASKKSKSAPSARKRVGLKAKTSMTTSARRSKPAVSRAGGKKRSTLARVKRAVSQLATR